MTNFIIINTSNILLSILFNLLLASIAILLCFFFLFLFKNIFTNPIVIENVRLQLALIIPTGAPLTAANNEIEMLPAVTGKTING